MTEVRREGSSCKENLSTHSSHLPCACVSDKYTSCSNKWWYFTQSQRKAINVSVEITCEEDIHLNQWYKEESSKFTAISCTTIVRVEHLHQRKARYALTWGTKKRSVIINQQTTQSRECRLCLRHKMSFFHNSTMCCKGRVWRVAFDTEQFYL